MKNYYLSPSIIATALTVLICSCREPAEDRIEATWKKINIENMTSKIHYEWYFESGQYIITRIDDNTGITDTTDIGIYRVRGTFIKKTVVMDYNEPRKIKHWNIDRLNNKILVLSRNTQGMEYLEFYKK